MTTNNRQRECIYGDEDNSPGLAHENAFLISENSDVEGDYRSRKSSGVEKASSKSFSGTAFHWLQQSGLVSVVPWLLEARQPGPKPPGEAPTPAQRASFGQVPIDGLDAPGKLLQSFPMPVRRVRRIKPVCPSVSGNRSAESEPFCESNKQFSSHRSNGFLVLYAYVNGNSRGCLLGPLKVTRWDCLW